MAAPTNVSYALLDAPVIAGHADDLLVGTTSHARLLEEVAAIGGVLRHFGVGVTVPVVIDLDDDQDAVVAALATARIGGVVHTQDQPDAPALVVSAGSPLRPRGPGDERLRLVRGAPVGAPDLDRPDLDWPDLDWGLLLRAGRTDPAAVEVLEPTSAYSPGRSVADQLAVLAATSAPYDGAELRRLLQV